jgi:hypothetical protein
MGTQASGQVRENSEWNVRRGWRGHEAGQRHRPKWEEGATCRWKYPSFCLLEAHASAFMSDEKAESRKGLTSGSAIRKTVGSPSNIPERTLPFTVPLNNTYHKRPAVYETIKQET